MFAGNRTRGRTGTEKHKLQRLLIIAFAPLRRDPRVLRQIELFRDHYQVITMGYGGAPDGVTKHVRLAEPGPSSLPQRLRKGVRMLLGRHKANYGSFPGVHPARSWLRDHGDEFDAVLTNDLSTVPVALETGKPVHADLHEYALGQHADRMWRLYQLPVLEMCADQLTQVNSTTSVANGIAALYDENWGTNTQVVVNAPRYRDADLPSAPVGRPIRLVYMGVARAVRSLNIPIEAVKRVNAAGPGSLTLDMFLMPAEPGYVESLLSEAGDLSGTGIRINDPVPAEQMVDVLADFDVAVVFFPPHTPNLKHVLPNKFFEAVQARIGVIIGPSPEMVPYVQECGFGEVTSGWTVDDLTQTLGSLTPEKVDSWKVAADRAARDLSSEQQSTSWEDAVGALFQAPDGLRAEEDND